MQKKLAIKNWERIRKNKANCLLVESYNESTDEKLSWILGIKQTLEKNGMASFFINKYDDKPNFINKRLFQTLCDQFHQNAFETIRNEGSKLRTYAIFKTAEGLEKYLVDIKNTKLRCALTKLRLSNHNLLIETGRHKKGKMETKKELRICPLCHDGIEDEAHFLLFCPVYNDLRNQLYMCLNLPNNFQYYSANEKLKFIMINLDDNIAKFNYNCFELRHFLLSNPKRNV